MQEKEWPPPWPDDGRLQMSAGNPGCGQYPVHPPDGRPRDRRTLRPKHRAFEELLDVPGSAASSISFLFHQENGARRQDRHSITDARPVVARSVRINAMRSHNDEIDAVLHRV